MECNNDKICNTCKKKDVCMYKAELEQAIEKITQTLKHTDVFIVDIKCKKWFPRIVNRRECIPLSDQLRYLEEDYVTGKGR